jgi:hypothetical protein
MQKILEFRKLLIAAAIVISLFGALIVYALAGLGANPVVFAGPPPFVEEFATRFQNTNRIAMEMQPATDCRYIKQSDFAELSPEEQLVRNVFFCNASPDLFLQLFTHPEKEQRVRIAAAFAAVNAEFTHDEESGFSEKREQFWIDSEKHLPNMRNALFEALITSAEKGEISYIPYTMAWMPGQGHETVELLAWAIEHHPS